MQNKNNQPLFGDEDISRDDVSPVTSLATPSERWFEVNWELQFKNQFHQIWSADHQDHQDHSSETTFCEIRPDEILEPSLGSTPIKPKIADRPNVNLFDNPTVKCCMYGPIISQLNLNQNLRKLCSQREELNPVVLLID